MTPRKPTRAVQLGVTDDDYARMLEEQDGHCALCPSTPKTRRFSVDHDHKTGAVRGLLCHRCNRALPTWITSRWLHAAAAYLDAAEDEPGPEPCTCTIACIPQGLADNQRCRLR